MTDSREHDAGGPPFPVSWKPPSARNALDRFIGPGATRAELLLQLIPPLMAGGALVVWAEASGLGWAWWQQLVAFLLMVDLLGGVLTNATSTAKRWYHRPGQGFRQHYGFVALHVLQPMLVVLCFDRGAWAWALAGYGYLLAAALLVLLSPLYLRRPVALLLLLGGLLLSGYVLESPPGFGWFLAVYYVKLLVSHLLPEAPFRPAKGR